MFTVRLADIERGKRQYEWELPTEWLRQTFEGTDATVTRAGKLQCAISETSRQVLVRGHAEASVTMPCARTLEPVALDLVAEIFLLLRPSAVTTSQTSPTGPINKRPATATHAATKTAKTARRPESELSDEDAAEDVYYGETVELDDFVREFLLLELPMMPLRSDLRSEERPAIPPTPESGEGTPHSKTVDPRLQPLAELANRLGKKST